MLKVGIVGATGYTGLELIKILSRRDDVKICVISSRKEEGQTLGSVFPSLLKYKDMVFVSPDAQNFEGCDFVFSCLPHAASAQLCAQLYQSGIKIIDLSADFRYTDLSLYEKTYSVKHPAPEILAEAVYGLCEINREKIKYAKIVGNPGCYTTSAILPLYPIINEGLVKPQGIIIDSKSGTSGAGRKAEIGLIHSEVYSNFKAYGVTTHRHTSEIEEALSVNTNKDVVVSFTPHLLPIERGILSTIYAPLNKQVNEIDVYDIYNKYYGGEKFIRVSKELPEIKWVAGTNNVIIGFKIDRKNNNLIIISVLDNLIKGASGQAVQNLNIMAGLEESAGLII